MKSTAVALVLLIVFAIGAYAQSPPTLRIVADDPTLPADLFYGTVKVKPVRIRPGTNPPVVITIDDSDFFVNQHYVDFLSRFPEKAGFDSWLNYLNTHGCANDPECLHQARLTVSASFFNSQEFNLKGGYVFRFYKASLARMPSYQEMVTGMRAVTGATGPEVDQKRAQFATDWVQRQDFLTSFPLGMSATAFVDGVLQKAGITVSNRSQIISDLTTAGADTTAGRAVAVRAIADSPEETNHEFNPAWVYMQYVGYLRREPETAGFNAWLTFLNNNPTQFSEMIRGFVDSVEYRNRF
jgi:hypothetical protein